MSFFENTRKPVGFRVLGWFFMMNVGHSAVARWGLQFLELAPDAKVLDCGCGGGANIKRLLKKCPRGVVIFKAHAAAFLKSVSFGCFSASCKRARRSGVMGWTFSACSFRFPMWKEWTRPCDIKPPKNILSFANSSAELFR